MAVPKRSTGFGLQRQDQDRAPDAHHHPIDEVEFDTLIAGGVDLAQENADR